MSKEIAKGREKMSVKAYAVKHRLSIFSVIKMVKAGELKSETVTEDGKERLYILIDKEREREIKQKIISPKESRDESQLKREVERLTREVRAMRAELEILKKELKREPK